VARDENLDAATMESALTHADSCEPCDALLEEAESLTRSLRALAMSDETVSAPVRVEKAVLQAFRQRRQPTDHAARIRRWSTVIAGIAAAVVVVFVLAGRPGGLFHFAGGTAAKNSVQPATPNLAGSTTAAQQASLGTSDDAIGTDSFVPLSGAFDLASLGDDPVVRVVLSGDDLENLGLPVGDSGDDQVVADLILANDGTPQAIRVVSW
jgi:hypothetical protein